MPQSLIDEYFFFSYARKDETNPAEDHEEMIYQFYKDLAAMIRALVNDPKTGTVGLLSDEDPVGFIDRNLPPGADYVQSLPAALQRCKSIVCLYSERYFTRKICGQEAQVFLDRFKQDIRSPEVILPVLWQPAERLTIPPAMSSFQFDSNASVPKAPPFPAEYRQLGLRELMVKNMTMPYRLFLVGMANWILRAHAFKLAPLTQPVDMSTYAMAFPNIPAPSPSGPPGVSVEGPRAVRFVYMATTSPPWAWTPFPPPPPAHPIWKLAVMVAVEKGFFPDTLELPSGISAGSFIDELLKAKQTNTPVVLLIDPRTLQLTTYSTLLDRYDDVNFLNCAALVVWDSSSSTPAQRRALEDLIGKVFDDSLARTSQFFLADIGSAEALTNNLSKVLDDLLVNVRWKGLRKRDVPGKPSPVPGL